MSDGRTEANLPFEELFPTRKTGLSKQWDFTLQLGRFIFPVREKIFPSQRKNFSQSEKKDGGLLASKRTHVDLP